MLPELRTVDELGAELWPTWDASRRRRWVYRQIEEHGLPVIRLGRSVVIDVAAAREWFLAQTATNGNGGRSDSHEQGPPR